VVTQMIDDRGLEAVRGLAGAVVRKRGGLSDADLRAFLDAGHQPHQVLEVLVGVTLKTLSNYTNHLAHTPLDAAFAANAWQPPPTDGDR
jgi:alkylhydroperoxidase family enzyme